MCGVLRVCSITPHLPPEQAANALLPRQLGDALIPHGVVTSYVSHPPAGGIPPAVARDVVYVPRRGRGTVARSRAGALLAAATMAVGARAAVRRSDLVHLHGNGFIIETGHVVARRYRRPTIVTLYGTDVWHHDEAKHARFGRVVREASARVFYSRGLLEFARPLGLAPDPSAVIYAPVPSTFRALDDRERAALRRELGIGDAPLLLTVKRLHDVAGYDVLLDAFARMAPAMRDAQLWIVGEGERRRDLEAQARRLGLGAQVRFLGLLGNDTLWRFYGAADLFVLPSRLESWGTVMLEALACGTRVVATDTVGGMEVQTHFPQDVMLAPKENPAALADAVVSALATRARAGGETARTLRSTFSVAGCAAAYLDVYKAAVHAG